MHMEKNDENNRPREKIYRRETKSEHDSRHKHHGIEGETLAEKSGSITICVVFLFFGIFAIVALILLAIP